MSCRLEEAFALDVLRVLEFKRAVRESQRTLPVLSPRYLVDDISRFFELLALTYMNVIYRLTNVHTKLTHISLDLIVL